MADNPGLGGLLFEARIPRPSGQLTVGFGAGGSLVVGEQNAAIHRWSLADAKELPGMPPGERLRDGIHVYASTSVAAVVIARAWKLTVVHFDAGGYRIAAEVPLRRMEFLIRGKGDRFATRDGHRIAVRDYADGSVVWEQPGPATAAVTLDPAGSAVAVADSSVWRNYHKVTVATRDNRDLFGLTLGNIPLAACGLGLSPGAGLLGCASFREVVLARPHTREIVFSHQLGSFTRDVVPALGTRPQQVVCTETDEILWHRGHRVVMFTASSPEPRDVVPDGGCHDIAFDHAGSRLAAVHASGLVRVWRWNGAPAESRPHHSAGVSHGQKPQNRRGTARKSDNEARK